MKKLVIIILFILLSFPVFAVEQDFQERLYCKFSGNSVRVYLLKEDDTIRCVDYISVVNRYLKKEYDSIAQIMANRNRWDDVEYWESLYEEKKNQFLKLFSQRMMIQNAVETFETELLDRCKLLLWETLEKKKQDLDLQIPVLEEELKMNVYNIRAERALQELYSKKRVVVSMLEAPNMTTFLNEFSIYLTLFPFTQSWK